VRQKRRTVGSEEKERERERERERTHARPRGEKLLRERKLPIPNEVHPRGQ